MSMTWTPVAAQYTAYLRLVASVNLLIIVVLAGSQYLIGKLSSYLPNWYWPLAVWLVVVLLFLLVWAPRRYLYTGYALTNDAVYFRRGALWRSQRGVPLNRIQHVELKESLFERMFGLASLVIYTAGSSGADLSIPGLEKVTAATLKQRLLDYVAAEPAQEVHDDD